MTQAADDFMDGDRSNFDELPLDVRKEIWDRMPGLYDWAATENSRGNDTDMDDLITFFAREADPNDPACGRPSRACRA